MITPVSPRIGRHSRPYSYTPASLTLLCTRCDNLFMTFRSLGDASTCGPCCNAAHDAGLSDLAAEASGS